MNEKINLTFRALKYRNYRLFFSGQFISLVGTWIQQIAMSWLIYSLTKSPLLMGTIVFVSSVPAIFLSPFAGVLIDRVNKHKFLILLQALFMLEAFVLALLTLAGIIKVWHIVVLSVLMGLTNTFDMPLRQAFVVNLIDKPEDLTNAISLNSSCFNLARLTGPAIAGILIAKFGEGLCFLLNALSYIAVIFALSLMKIQVGFKNLKQKPDVLKEFNEGIQYALASKPIKLILLFFAISSLIGMSFQVLMPIYVKEVLLGNAKVLGCIMSVSGIGALFGALYLAGRKTHLGLEKWIYASSLLLSLGLIGLSFANKVLWASILLFVIGFGMVIIIAACNTMIQHLVDNERRGRIMSLCTMAFIGAPPIGSLFCGIIADKIGVGHTFLLCGVVMLCAASIFRNKLKYFRPIEIIATDEKLFENELQLSASQCKNN